MLSTQPITPILHHRQENNFDILRLVAAWLVLFSHSYGLYYGSTDWFHQTLGYEQASSIGLNIFFTISGYLVTASYINQPRFTSFMLKRILRIVPGLFVVLALSALIMGPLVTTLPLSTYFTETATYKYIRGALVFTIKYFLPGVFADLPFPAAVNGSLWTLKIEARCYLLIGILGAFSLLNRAMCCPLPSLAWPVMCC